MHVFRILLCTMLLNARLLHGMEQQLLSDKKEDKQSAYDYDKYPLLAHLPLELCRIVQSYGKFEQGLFWTCGGRSITSIAWSHDGKYLAISDSDHHVCLWDAATGEEIRICAKHGKRIRSLAWSPDGSYLASGANDGVVILWDCVAGNEKHRFKNASWVYSVAFDPTSNYLASGGIDRKVHVWDCSTGKEVCAYDHKADVSSIAFSPDGHYIFCADIKGLIFMLECATGKLVRTYEGHQGCINALRLSASGRYLATASNDSTVCLWDLALGEAGPCLYHDSPVHTVAWSSDNAQLASLNRFDEGVHIWDQKTGEKTQTLKLDYHARAVAFAPGDPCMLAIAKEDGIQICTRLRLVPPASDEKKTIVSDHEKQARSIDYAQALMLLSRSSKKR